ncbi:MAG: GNAT family N-acetyltransferase [Gemmataceae bacterium]
MPDPSPGLTIPTARLMLVLQSPSEVMAWVESLPPSDRAEISSGWLDMVRQAPPGDPWSLGFRILDKGTGLVVGGCMFKGPPKDDGIVEIAYGIDPPWRGCGFATEAAAGLAVFARGTGLVRLVCAHTRADNPASMRVLEKAGFLRAGGTIDPEDGPLLRWEKT